MVFRRVLSWCYFYFLNIFICDLFLIKNNLNSASYADNTMVYVIGDGVTQINESLEEASDENLLVCK